MILTLVLFASSAVAQGWQREVASPNGRYVAELRPHASGADGLAAGAPLDLVVYELGDAGTRQEVWSGIVPHDPRPDAERRYLLSDDGAAFVDVVARTAPRGETTSTGNSTTKIGPVLVREILKGTNAAVLRAEDLHLGVDSVDSTWIDLEHGLRWRPDASALNAHWQLDLLGEDGLVRTLELDRGALVAHFDETRSLDLFLQPPVPEPVRPATRETYVDSWAAPALAYAGTTVEVEGHGHFASEGWRFIGFRVVGDPFATRKLVLVPNGVPPRGASAQILRPHLWTARFNGLPPGVFELDVCGAETPPGDPRRDPMQHVADARTIELVSPHRIVQLARAVPATESAEHVRSIALFDDGRYEIARGERTTSALAPLGEWQSIESRVRALADSAPRTVPSADEARASGILTWRASGAPARVALNASAPTGVRALADDLERIAARFDPRSGRALYVLDPARSSLHVHTGSAGLFSAFGHDHELAARTFTATFDVDTADIWRSRVTFRLDASSLRVVDEASRDDAAEIERNMAEDVLHTARFPTVEFKSGAIQAGAVAPRKGVPPGAATLATFGDPAREVTLTGELTLHGVTRTISIPGRLELDAGRLHVFGEFTLKQTDYSMKPYSAVGGAVKVDDKLRLVYDFVAPRSEK